MVDLLYKLSVLVKGYREKDAATEVVKLIVVCHIAASALLHLLLEVS